MNIDIGTVFRWSNFPYPKYDNETKARWFICIGRSGMFAQIATVYLCTTTTQVQSFQGSGNRSLHDHFIFHANQFPVFEQDCVIDFDEQPYSIESAKLFVNQADITIRGKIGENTLRMIYNRLRSSKFVSPTVLSDIHDSFNRAGITGLRNPKRPKK